MNTPQMPSVVYAAFSSPIDPPAVQRIITGLTTAMVGRVNAIHLFFHSTGGTVGDGIALYNFFKALPIDLTLYNPGIVASIATVAYLGAAHRKVSQYATFGLHRTRFQQPQPAQAGALRALAQAAVIDDRRTEQIIRAHTNIPRRKWAHLNNYDLNLTAQEAVNYGIADEIRDFAPPSGAVVYNI